MADLKDMKRHHQTLVKLLGTQRITELKFGNLLLNVFPFDNKKDIKLPSGFGVWEKPVNDIKKLIPLQNGADTHYLTIDSKYFPDNEYQRREGIHMDGNFCVDPYFSWGYYIASLGLTNEINDKFPDKKLDPPSRTDDLEKIKTTWGGGSPSWGGITPNGFSYESDTMSDEVIEEKRNILRHALNQYKTLPNNAHVNMTWKLPYDITIPIGDYVSDKKGGILTVSNQTGCKAWSGTFYGIVRSGGDFRDIGDQLNENNETLLEANQLYFMTSNTPHQTLLQKKGTRRTFIRITLNHNYINDHLRLS